LPVELVLLFVTSAPEISSFSPMSLPRCPLCRCTIGRSERAAPVAKPACHCCSPYLSCVLMSYLPLAASSRMVLSMARYFGKSSSWIRIPLRGVFKFAFVGVSVSPFPMGLILSPWTSTFVVAQAREGISPHQTPVACTSVRFHPRASLYWVDCSTLVECGGDCPHSVVGDVFIV
jgi:hypothetical protein